MTLYKKKKKKRKKKAYGGSLGKWFPNFLTPKPAFVQDNIDNICTANGTFVVKKKKKKRMPI